jgi:hypothetical protein
MDVSATSRIGGESPGSRTVFGQLARIWSGQGARVQRLDVPAV